MAAVEWGREEPFFFYFIFEEKVFTIYDEAYHTSRIDSRRTLNRLFAKPVDFLFAAWLCVGRSACLSVSVPCGNLVVGGLDHGGDEGVIVENGWAWFWLSVCPHRKREGGVVSVLAPQTCNDTSGGWVGNTKKT